MSQPCPRPFPQPHTQPPPQHSTQPPAQPQPLVEAGKEVKP